MFPRSDPWRYCKNYNLGPKTECIFHANRAVAVKQHGCGAKRNDGTTPPSPGRRFLSELFSVRSYQRGKIVFVFKRVSGFGCRVPIGASSRALRVRSRENSAGNTLYALMHKTTLPVPGLANFIRLDAPSSRRPHAHHRAYKTTAKNQKIPAGLHCRNRRTRNFRQ